MELRASVEAALAVSGIPDTDRAAADLALTYAAALDDTGPECEECGRHGGELEKLGPLLLKALEALRMTPHSRAAVMKGGKDDKPATGLDHLAQRRARKGRAETLDAAAP